MAVTTGIVLFDDAEELDFVGPWEVFTVAAMLNQGNRVVTIAATAQPVRCAKGLRVLPDHTFADAPALDVVLVPGGAGTTVAMSDPVLIGWLRGVAARCTWVTSVCSGAAVLHGAGLTKGKRVTTHWGYVETLRQEPDITVLDNTRYVRDGNVVTSAGVSAGIDMALWLVGQLHGVEMARNVQHWIEYNPAPPYTADV